MNGLVTALNVNDREPPHSQTGRSIEMESVVIWTAMSDSASHALDQVAVHVPTVCTNYACNATHVI